MNKVLIVVISLLVIYGCKKPNTSNQSEEVKVAPSFPEYEEAIHWYVIGDFGRNGQYGQQELADQMDQFARKVEPEFIVAVGDNIYPEGVASVHDPQWRTSFEDVYRGQNLHCKWYAILGNHDYRGNPQAQVDYTDISQRWHMPERYYVQNIEDDGISVQMVFIDTNPFEDKYYSSPKYTEVLSQDSTKQLLWMDSVLTDNSADWKVVVGHHPLYSGGKRLNKTGDVRGHLEKVLKKHNVDLYFAGHEHDLQHIHNPSYATHHIVSGAGSEVRPTGEMEYTKFAAAKTGFVAVSILKNKLLVRFIDVTGEQLYSFELEK